jgi:predicted Zn-ribbon and HTH transcriptional regulator
MKIICQNCGYEFDTKDVSFHTIKDCPKCNAPYTGNGLGIAWV